MHARAASASIEPVATLRELAARYAQVRRFTEAICDPLTIEDHVVQPSTEVSPAKWHLAHTTWFFETFVLERWDAEHPPFDPNFRFLFNSYYEAVGPRHARPERGLLSRPGVEQIRAYRLAVDERMRRLLARDDVELPDELRGVIGLGIHHEQQHQELLYTDIKNTLSFNPLYPAYDPSAAEIGGGAPPQGWLPFAAGVREVGHAGGGFAFDNETPRHRVFLEGFELARRPVTNREWLAFVDDGGYRRAELWLSDGWDAVRSRGWQGPLYWRGEAGDRREFTLHGLHPLSLDAPVCHVSYYEADAYANWGGARLPTEAEWEVAAAQQEVAGNFAAGRTPVPRPAPDGGPPHGLLQPYGDVWEWTSSAYSAYPGFRPAPGAIGEYNGKFMCNQMVLRGGSCATPLGHLRPSYRNFFHPDARWQFSGVRLARSSG
jgi:ergothioneine biosynthesis protein EgtB